VIRTTGTGALRPDDKQILAIANWILFILAGFEELGADNVASNTELIQKVAYNYWYHICPN